MNAPTHILNWHFGWWLVLSAFVTGAAIGLFFHHEQFTPAQTEQIALVDDRKPPQQMGFQ